jgi:glycosyltransferase involved in cell wall biosynthesis/trans-aconitate methyltransferase
MKIAVFIVAYNARKTIGAVLDRIPTEMWEKLSEVYVFDDASQDETARTASEYEGPYKDRVTVFGNQVNLGYGGNQKRGYRYAMEQNYDVVVLLHGDGQYAPECMGDLIEPIVKGEAQAVFGSRMMTKGAALKGGMPLYKLVGNKILSAFQNFLLPDTLTEFHSGYRAYYVPELKKLPLLNNTNDFHFDTEIIIQLMEVGAEIKEVPIPTYYGDEICHVDGIRYAWDVFKTTLAYKLHKKGLIYDRRFDLRTGSKYTYKRNRYSSHEQILAMIPTQTNPDERDKGEGALPTILDVGCGSGLLSRAMATKGYSITGIDAYDSKEAAAVCDSFIKADLDQGLTKIVANTWDCIVFADVLEHVREPEKLLLQANSLLTPNGVVIASTGNVAHFLIRIMLLFGRFHYTERGILDRTHVRLFTVRSFKKLFDDCSYDIVKVSYCPIPFENVFPGHDKITDFLSWVYMLPVKLWASLFCYQTIIEARPRTKRPSDLMKEQQILKTYEPYQPPVSDVDQVPVSQKPVP